MFEYQNIFDYYVKLLKSCHTFWSACKVYSHILASDELTKEEKATLGEIYDALTDKMPYVMD